jgi:hypothetical protein
LIDGQVYFDRQKDIARRAELEKEKKALVEKESKAAEAARRPGRPGGGQRMGPPGAGQRPPQKRGEAGDGAAL